MLGWISRTARNEEVFRTINDLIDEGAKQHGVEQSLPFHCECADDTCVVVDKMAGRRISLAQSYCWPSSADRSGWRGHEGRVRVRSGEEPPGAPDGGVQRLSGQDSSFLALETPSTPMHIGWAAILDPEDRRRPTGGDLADLIADRIHLMPAFRHRLAPRRLGMVQPDWVDVDVDHGLAGRHPDTDLLRLCGAVLSPPLDRSRPLWELHMAPDLPDGRIALVVKMHHAIVDGPSGAELMVALLDLDPTVARLSPGTVPAADPGPTTARRWRTAARRLARGSRRAPGDLRTAARVGRSLRKLGRRSSWPASSRSVHGTG